MSEKTEDESFGTSLIKSIANEDLAGLAEDIAEIPIDQILDYDAIKSLPLVGMLAGGVKTYLNVRDYFFIKKIAKFLQDLNSFSEQETEGFARKIDDDPKHRKRVGEKLIVYLDRFDDVDKASILAKLFRGYLRGEINYDYFLKLSRAVDLAFIGDIYLLLEHYEVGENGRRKNPWVPWEALFSSGLAKAVLNVNIDQEFGLLGTSGFRRAEDLVSYTDNSAALLLSEVVLGEKHISYYLNSLHNS